MPVTFPAHNSGMEPLNLPPILTAIRAELRAGTRHFYIWDGNHEAPDAPQLAFSPELAGLLRPYGRTAYIIEDATGGMIGGLETLGAMTPNQRAREVAAARADLARLPEPQRARELAYLNIIDRAFTDGAQIVSPDTGERPDMARYATLRDYRTALGATDREIAATIDELLQPAATTVTLYGAAHQMKENDLDDIAARPGVSIAILDRPGALSSFYRGGLGQQTPDYVYYRNTGTLVRLNTTEARYDFVNPPVQPTQPIIDALRADRRFHAYFDLNGDGRLAVQEIRSKLTAIGMDRLDDYDLNADGFASQSEFFQSLREHIDVAERNRR